MYDPSKIDTKILDISFQNKINESADQYFQGKMNDDGMKDFIKTENHNSIKENEINNFQKNNSDLTLSNNRFKEEINHKKEEIFEVPKVPEKKRKSRFDI